MAFLTDGLNKLFYGYDISSISKLPHKLIAQTLDLIIDCRLRAKFGQKVSILIHNTKKLVKKQITY